MIKRGGRPPVKVEEEEEDELAWSSKETSDVGSDVDEGRLLMHTKVWMDVLRKLIPEADVLSPSTQLCHKCHEPPSSELLRRYKKRKGRKSKLDDMVEDDKSLAERLGGWMSCLKCSSSYHWVGGSGGAIPLHKADASLPDCSTALEVPPAATYSRSTNCVMWTTA
jgi:hypothetical protein